MDGVAILRHGLSMLLRNLGPALRVSVGPFLIAIVAVVALLLLASGLGVVGLDPATGTVTAAPTVLVLLALVAVLVVLVVFSWVAVAWHRYILKEEPPGLLPPFRADLVWPYLGRSVLLALILIVAAIPLSLVLGLVAGSLGSVAAAVVMGLALSLVLGWIGTRLSLVLPARAVDRPMTFGESWAATAPASGAILAVVLILALLNMVLGTLFTAILGENLLSAILDLIVQWFTTMLGLSVLTTLYGHLVERRPLTA
jgi:hypothetical protein